MTVYTGLYYSYIEQEKYKQAEQLLNDVDRLIPTYKYSQAKGWINQVILIVMIISLYKACI